MSQDDRVKKEGSKTTREEAVARMKQRMENDAKWPEGHPPPQKGMSSFRKAMLWTAILTVLLAPIALVGGIIAAIVFGVKDQDEISRGIWTGLGIGISIVIIGLGITCFVALVNF